MRRGEGPLLPSLDRVYSFIDDAIQFIPLCSAATGAGGNQSPLACHTQLPYPFPASFTGVSYAMSTKASTSDPIENEEELAPDIVDDEDIGQDKRSIQPWDPSKIRITTKHFTLRDVVQQIKDEEIDLSPEFQRDYVWKKKQRTRLVESILLGIPLPAFYFNQDSDGIYQVVDGVQRLSTVSLFMKNAHTLDQEDLEYLKLGGLAYEDLEPADLRRFRSTQIVVHIIEPQTPDEVKYDIFSRVNTLGSPLSAQEIRHAMSKARSRQFLKDLVELDAFDRATSKQFWRMSPDSSNGTPANNGKPARYRDSGRMTNRELALRFCAFRHYSDSEYRQHPSLNAFLVEYTRRLDMRSESGVSVTDQELAVLRADFERAMENACHVLGKAAFRRWPLGQKRRGPINRAVFEAQAIALADYSLDQISDKRNEIAESLRRAFDDQDYTKSVTVGTGSPAAVEMRIQKTKEILAEAVK